MTGFSDNHSYRTLPSMTRPNRFTKSVPNTHESFKPGVFGCHLMSDTIKGDRRQEGGAQYGFNISVGHQHDAWSTSINLIFSRRDKGIFSEPMKVFVNPVSTNEWNSAPPTSISRYVCDVMSGSEQESRVLRTSDKSTSSLLEDGCGSEVIPTPPSSLGRSRLPKLIWGILSFDSGSLTTFEHRSFTSIGLSTL